MSGGDSVKKSRTCVKCGGTRIVEIGDFGEVRVRTGLVSYTFVDCCICCDCGYLELWTPERSLDKLYETYKWTVKNDSEDKRGN